MAIRCFWKHARQAHSCSWSSGGGCTCWCASCSNQSRSSAKISLLIKDIITLWVKSLHHGLHHEVHHELRHCFSTLYYFYLPCFLTFLHLPNSDHLVWQRLWTPSLFWPMREQITLEPLSQSESREHFIQLYSFKILNAEALLYQINVKHDQNPWRCRKMTFITILISSQCKAWS